MICNNYDKVIRQLIEKETDIVNNKINWGFVMHGILLSAYWYVINSEVDNLPLYQFLVILVGIIFSTSSIYSLWTNERAIAFILSKWNAYLAQNDLSHENFPPVWAGSQDAVNNILDVNGKFKIWFYKNIYFHTGFMSMYNMIPKLFLFVWSIFGIIFISHLM